MTTLLTAGLHRLGDSTVNFYVLDLTVVDTGLPAHYAQLTALLAGIGRSVRDIRAVLLTHAHPDHLGLAERIRREAAATVWSTNWTPPLLRPRSGRRPAPSRKDT